MKKLKRQALNGFLRLAVVVWLFLYPVVALLALPWVLFTNIGQMGYTTFDEWKEGWSVYENVFTLEFWK